MAGPVATGATLGGDTTVGVETGAAVGLTGTSVGEGAAVAAVGREVTVATPAPGERVGAGDNPIAEGGPGVVVGGNDACCGRVVGVGIGGAGGRAWAAPPGNGVAMRPSRRRSDQTVTNPPAAGRSRPRATRRVIPPSTTRAPVKGSRLGRGGLTRRIRLASVSP